MKGAVFDVDGTILNSMGAWFDATYKFFDEQGIVMDAEQINEFKEMPLEESIPKIKNDNDLNMTVEEIFAWFLKYVGTQYELHIPAKKGVCEYIKRLHERGVKIALATSGYKDMCEKAFKRLGIWDYIGACAFSSEVGVNKSHPDVYLLAAERIGIDPEECVVFEDIVTGLRGAKIGGFKTVAVADDSNEGQRGEMREIADMYINDFTELLNANGLDNL